MNIAIAGSAIIVRSAFVTAAAPEQRCLTRGEQILAQQRALDAQRKLASLAQLRYQNGVAQYIEVLDAERNLFSSEQAMVSLRSSEL